MSIRNTALAAIAAATATFACAQGTILLGQTADYTGPQAAPVHHEALVRARDYANRPPEITGLPGGTTGGSPRRPRSGPRGGESGRCRPGPP